jgi:hypothetical protein
MGRGTAAEAVRVQGFQGVLGVSEVTEDAGREDRGSKARERGSSGETAVGLTGDSEGEQKDLQAQDHKVQQKNDKVNL